MKGILLIARTYLLTALRERITLFWFLIFPVFLLVLLTVIFGNIGQEGEINFSIALINLDAKGGWGAGMIEGLFEEAATAKSEEKEPLFTLSHPDEGEVAQEFLSEQKAELRKGSLAAVIVIPEGFSDQLNRQVMDGDVKIDADALRIYYSQGDTSSEMAAEIIEQILAGVNREILIRTGLFQESAAIPSEQVWVGQKTSQVSYINFLLPGIILMGYFINGLFGIPGSILFSRDQHVLRRYWVTPLNVPRFLAGLSLGHLALCLIQSLILLLLGRYALGATISFAGVTTVVYLLLSAITFMAFGFLIASLARTANAGMAIANILNMPMMFLSGLFFPTGGLPAAIMVIVYVNPLSYLAAGIRTSVGVESGVFSGPLIMGVPLAWIALSIAVAARRLRWDVGR